MSTNPHPSSPKDGGESPRLPMPRKPGFHYRDTPPEVLDLFISLSKGGEGSTVYSLYDTSASIHAFRNRIYRWRRSMLDILAHTERSNRAAHEEALEWIDGVLPHPSHLFVRDFLYLTIFQIEQHPDNPNLYRLKGTLRKPLFTSPEKAAREPSPQALEDSLRLLREAGIHHPEDL